MKSEKSTMIVVGIIRIVLAIFIPFILFAELGVLAGYAFHTTSRDMTSKKDKEVPHDDEEHI